MPITSHTLNTSTPTQIATAKSRGQRAWVRIHNDGPGSARIGIGVSDITTSRGDVLEEGCGCYIDNEDHASPATLAMWAMGISTTPIVHVTEGGAR